MTPYANSTRNLCGVTKRRNVLWDQTTGPPNGRPERVGALVEPPTAQRPWPLFEFAGKSHVYTPDENDPNLAAEITLLERACSNPDFLIGLLEEVCEEIRALVEENAVLIGVSGRGRILGGVSTLLGLLAALLAILAILLAIVAALRAGGGGRRLGQVLDDLRGSLLEQPTPELRMAGVFVWQCIAYKIFKDQQKAHDFDAISYAVMDIHDYHDMSCNVNVDSIEVVFPADSPMLLAFVDALIGYEIRQEQQGRAFLGYASIRFTGKTRALIGEQRWERTAVVEVACLKDVAGSKEMIDFAISLARNPNYGAILHWGQRDEFTAQDTQRLFGDLNDPRPATSAAGARLSLASRAAGISSAPVSPSRPVWRPRLDFENLDGPGASKSSRFETAKLSPARSASSSKARTVPMASIARLSATRSRSPAPNGAWEWNGSSPSTETGTRTSSSGARPSTWSAERS